MSVQVYQPVPGEWVVAENHVWLPGVYDSEETARRAVTFTDEALLALRPIYQVDGEDRPVTAADLDSVEAQIA